MKSFASLKLFTSKHCKESWKNYRHYIEYAVDMIS